MIGFIQPFPVNDPVKRLYEGDIVTADIQRAVSLGVFMVCLFCLGEAEFLLVIPVLSVRITARLQRDYFLCYTYMP